MTSLRAVAGVVALAVALLAGSAGAAQAASLTTTYAGGNGNQGVSFDLTVKTARGIEVRGFDINTGAATVTVEVWVRSGTAAGSLSSRTGWTSLGSQTVTGQGFGNPTPVPLAFALGPGTHGIAVGTAEGLDYNNGQSTVEDAALRFDSGSGLGDPILNGGMTIPDRIFNGTVHYDIRAPSVGSGPSGPSSDPTPTFGFSAGGDPDTPECRIYRRDTPAPLFSACSGPGSTHTPAAPLSDGDYSFEVRTVNADSNRSLVARRDFSVHTGPLATTTIGSGPNGATRSRTPAFAFSAGVPATFECRVFPRGSAVPAFGACSGPGGRHLPAAPLADGAYTFQVRGVNQGDAPGPVAARNFAVDTVAPGIVFSDGPADGSTVTTTGVTFAFRATEAGARLACSADGGAFASCNSPRALSGLGPGAHTFAVRATDAAGNTGAPVTRRFTVGAPSSCAETVSDWTAAQRALSRANKALTRARRALKRARASGSRAKVRRARAALRKRTRAASRARAALRRTEAAVRDGCS